jgi:hypothetical protein
VDTIARDSAGATGFGAGSRAVVVLAVSGFVSSADFLLDVMVTVFDVTVVFGSDVFFFLRLEGVSSSLDADADLESVVVASLVGFCRCPSSWVFDESLDFEDPASEELDFPSSAAAIAALLAIAAPIPSATANPPTLPMNRP